MRRQVGVVFAGVILSSCRHAAILKDDKPQAHQEAVTHWTARTELFLEYPTLVAGVKGRFAVHFTSLDTFQPLKSGKVEVLLNGKDGSREVFTTAGPSRPGIFGVDVEPKRPGEYQMSVGLSAPAFRDRHELGAVTVYPDEKAAVHEDRAAKEETISFLKEQQWSLDFATEVVKDRPAREVMRVPAEIVPRPGGEAAVIAPFSGRLASSSLPPVGAPVQKGQVLATLLPPANGPSELPVLELAKTEAEAALQLARKDHQRAERLVHAGAAPARRLEEARVVEQTAAARVTAALARLSQYQTTREAAGDVPSTAPFLLRAPISGFVRETHAVAGANVEAGAALFQIIDAGTVYVAAIVTEAELPRIARFREAELEIPGRDGVRKLNRLVSVGRIVDPATRTFQVLYESSNPDRVLAIHQTAFARLLGPVGKPQPAVPVSSVVDDGGRPVVFVQLAGEAFARRPVRLGPSEGSYVQVAEGIQPGERIVSRGAYLIRLSALSNQIPAHGHVH